MLSRQEVDFLEKARKIWGCGSLKKDFIPDLYQNFRIWGCDMVKKMNSISVVNDCCRSAICLKERHKKA